MSPIVLAVPQRYVDSDDACLTVTKSVHPRFTPGNYSNPDQLKHVETRCVPSLAYFCIRALYRYVDQLHAVSTTKVKYNHPDSNASYDTIRALIPSYSPHPNDDSPTTFDLRNVDPRLWATLIQLYDGIPECLRAYHIPLSDEHLPQIQRILPSPHFSLITLVDLSKCAEVTDESISALKHLHTLCCLDLSSTQLSSYGIKVLADTQLWRVDGSQSSGVPERRGIWALRIINLRDCRKINNTVFNYLKHFPLLSVVDVRGTACQPSDPLMLPFQPSQDLDFFHPSPLCVALSALSKSSRHALYLSVTQPFEIHIDSLNHKPPPKPTAHSLSRQISLGRILPPSEEVKAALARIQAFYGHPDIDRKRQTKQTASENIVSSISSRDRKLMLFREPPPWADLESNSELRYAAFTSSKATSRSEETVANINRGKFKREIQRLQDLSTPASKRRKICLPTGFIVPHKSAPSVVKSKNPFAKPPDFGGPLPPRQVNTALPVANSLYTLSKGGSDPQKPLKPISTLRVPLLPAHLLSKPRPPVKKQVRLTEDFLNKTAGHNNSSDASVKPPPHPLSRSRTTSMSSHVDLSNEEKITTLRRTNSASSKKPLTSGKPTSRNKSSGNSGRNPGSTANKYDWKRWSMG